MWLSSGHVRRFVRRIRDWLTPYVLFLHNAHTGDIILR
jgi:hypothetical protein